MSTNDIAWLLRAYGNVCIVMLRSRDELRVMRRNGECSPAPIERTPCVAAWRVTHE